MAPFPRVALRILRVGSCRHPECVALRGGRWRAVEFPALVGLVLHPSGPLLFDTGYSPRFLEATRRLPERLYRWTTPLRLPAEETLAAQLALHGLAPGDVRGVFVSHFHADHVAGLGDLPHAQVWSSDAALRHATGLGRLAGLRRAVLPALLPPDLGARHVALDARPRRDLPGRWSVLGAGHDLLGDGSLLAVPLPGHARGQAGLLLRAEDDREVLLAADAAWSLRALRENRPPAWPARLVIDDWRAYCATLARLGPLASAEDVRVLPSHCVEAWGALPAAMRSAA